MEESPSSLVSRAPGVRPDTTEDTQGSAGSQTQAHSVLTGTTVRRHLSYVDTPTKVSGLEAEGQHGGGGCVLGQSCQGEGLSSPCCVIVERPLPLSGPVSSSVIQGWGSMMMPLTPR